MGTLPPARPVSAKSHGAHGAGWQGASWGALSREGAHVFVQGSQRPTEAARPTFTCSQAPEGTRDIG